MIKMTELEAYKLIVKGSFSLSLKMGDTFHWACADAEDMDGEDVEEIIPVVQKYGYDALVAYAALRRGYEPEIEQVKTPEYYAAKAELEELAKDGTILYFEVYAKQKDIEEQIKDFDGMTYIISKVDRFTRLLNAEHMSKLDWILKRKPKWRTVVLKATLTDGTFALGRSQAQLRERLMKKYNRIRKRKQDETS